MKLLFDQNLSQRLVTLLATEFSGSQHVRDAGMASAADPVVWAYAAKEGLVIVSKDSDFQQRAVRLVIGCARDITARVTREKTSTAA